MFSDSLAKFHNELALMEVFLRPVWKVINNVLSVKIMCISFSS